MTENEIQLWNDTVKETNKQLLLIDSKMEKMEFIEKKFDEFKQNPNFYYFNIEQWYRSQLIALGVTPCDFMFLYPSMFSQCKMI
ncbi:MAG: hypothetical protein [Wendovervirus sonii]|uniref:Uncharacterized protein n=1 Tax=phage Lak_Megaphage_Sonny TaxID=3109229 RepID=A0ABZ0Z315_9CAUD|nr:MAG: hypothetical protein [phage Lak_Megaphage_Sonny]